MTAESAGKPATMRPIPGLDRTMPELVTVNGMPVADRQGYQRLPLTGSQEPAQGWRPSRSVKRPTLLFR
jgi:hypothetical protein